MPATVIKPTLVGISASEVQVKVLNSEFVERDPAAPRDGAADRVRPRDAAARQPPADPRCRRSPGSRSTTSSIQHVTTTQDDFLALYATLGPSVQMRQLATQNRVRGRTRSPQMDAAIGRAAPRRRMAARTLRRVNTPTPEKIRASLTHKDDGAMPEVTFDVDRFDARGRELEWSYNLNGGMWHPYTADTPAFVDRDRGVRVAGQVRDRPQVARQGRLPHGRPTRSHAPVIIDSVGPRIFDDKVDVDRRRRARRPGVRRRQRAHDIEYAFGKPGAKAARDGVDEGRDRQARSRRPPRTSRSTASSPCSRRTRSATRRSRWSRRSTASRRRRAARADRAAAPSAGGIAARARRRWPAVRPGRAPAPRVFLRRPAGRVVSTLGSGSGPRRRCRSRRAAAAASTGEGVRDRRGLRSRLLRRRASCRSASTTPACAPMTSPPGRIGPYCDVATGADGSIWVSAYAQSHGDLVVAKRPAAACPTRRGSGSTACPMAR